MQDSNKKKVRSNSYRQFKRKIIFSQELKNSLFNAFCEAKNKQTYVNTTVLMYGLLSQPKSLCSRLFLKAVLLSKSNTTLSTQQINNRIKLFIKQGKINNLNQVSLSEINENEKIPFLTPEVKDILKTGVRTSLVTNKKVNIITTKDIFFELINRESMRELLSQLVN